MSTVIIYSADDSALHVSEEYSAFNLIIRITI